MIMIFPLVCPLAHLELCFRSAYAKACCLSSVSPSVVRLLLAFHIFDISSRSVHWIELKLNGRHGCNMEI